MAKLTPLFDETPPIVANGYHIEWKEEIKDLLASERRRVIEEMIKLSDEIELEEPDGGTKQWMAFKAFRNAMRDSLKGIDEN